MAKKRPQPQSPLARKQTRPLNHKLHQPQLLRKRVAVTTSADPNDKLVEAAEDAIDLKEAEAVKAENDFIPWDEVKAMLGLT